MRRLLPAALLAATLAGGPAPRTADAGVADVPARAPARRKAPPPGLPAEPLAKFIDAVVADKGGDPETAIRRYEDVVRKAPRDAAQAHYNLGDLYRRLESYRRAIDHYRKFVELATTDAERAEGERLIAQLKAAPGVVVVDGEDLDAVVYLDGKLVGPSPQVLQLADGRHVIDRIGRTSYRSRTVIASGGSREHARMTSTVEETGNVVLATSLDRLMTWDDEASGVRYDMPGRQQLAPGRHTTTPFKTVTCQPITFEAPKTGVAYVFVEQVGPPRAPSNCVPIKVTQSVVRFAR